MPLKIVRLLAEVVLFTIGCGLLISFGELHVYENHTKIAFFVGCVLAGSVIRLGFWVGGYRRV